MNLSGLLPSDLKEENRRLVLQAFFGESQVTVNEVAERIGISRQTVKKHILYFLEKEIVISLGKGDSTIVGGKRPELFQLNREIYFITAMQHHEDVCLQLTNLHLEHLRDWNSGKKYFATLGELWETIRQGCYHITENIDRKKIFGIAYSAPFGMDNEQRLTVATPFPHWPESDYGRYVLQPFLDVFPEIPILKVISDGIAAGYGYLSKEYPNIKQQGIMASLYTSFGVGGSIIYDGSFPRDSYLGISAFGHLTVDISETQICSCGGQGCLEQMVNRQRMLDRLKRQSKAFQASTLGSLSPENVTFLDIFRAAENGDPFSRSESAYYASMYAVAVRNIYLATGPDLLVFQGDFGHADKYFKQRVTEQLTSFKYIHNFEKMKITYDTEDLCEREFQGLAIMLAEEFMNLIA